MKSRFETARGAQTGSRTACAAESDSRAPKYPARESDSAAREPDARLRGSGHGGQARGEGSAPPEEVRFHCSTADPEAQGDRLDALVEHVVQDADLALPGWEALEGVPDIRVDKSGLEALGQHPETGERAGLRSAAALAVAAAIGGDDGDPCGQVVDRKSGWVLEQREHGVLHRISRGEVVAGDARDGGHDRAVVAFGETLQGRRGAHELKLAGRRICATGAM